MSLSSEGERGSSVVSTGFAGPDIRGKSNLRGELTGEDATVAFDVEETLTGLEGSELSYALVSESAETEEPDERSVLELAVEDAVLDLERCPEFDLFLRR
jgi:hypothetical protein